MSYYDIYARYKDLDLTKPFDIAGKDERRLIALLSPQAEGHLEDMAAAAHEITLRNFGRAIQLYTPMYLSNYCDNECAYCGFSSKNTIERKRLSLVEVEDEARFIARTGLRHVLVLTGESRREAPVTYIKDCVKVLSGFFTSISIEVYPLTEEEYGQLVLEGADGLTIYQETYDEDLYAKMHPRGPKRDYRFRLDAAERGAMAGMRSVNIGALLGLGDWRREIFFMGLHAKYLQDKFPDVEIAVSLPRVRPTPGNFLAPHPASDKNIVQAILALRIAFPRLGITLSTREDPRFRENVVPLGITRMSAGSTTAVGGRTIRSHDAHPAFQFEIQDLRDVSCVMEMLGRKGYQGVLHDWVRV